MTEDLEIMWDNGSLNTGYNGSFESYEELVTESNPDIIYLNGAPDNEINDRVDWALVHQKNLIDYGTIQEEDVKFVGPKEEISKLNTKLGTESMTPVKLLSGNSNRLEEYQELSNYIEGDEEIHFIASDYTTGQDRVLQQHTMPDVEAEFIGAKTDKNTSTERLKRRLYAEVLRLSDRI